MTRAAIRAVLRRHKGGQRQVAERAGVSRATVNQWLKYGKPSLKVPPVALEVATELLQREQQSKNAA